MVKGMRQVYIVTSYMDDPEVQHVFARYPTRKQLMHVMGVNEVELGMLLDGELAIEAIGFTDNRSKKEKSK